MDDKKDDFVVIIATYPKHIQPFFDMNPGLKDRVPYRIDFPKLRRRRPGKSSRAIKRFSILHHGFRRSTGDRRGCRIAVRRAVDTAISKARAEGGKVADKGKGKAMVGEGFGGPWVE